MEARRQAAADVQGTQSPGSWPHPPRRTPPRRHSRLSAGPALDTTVRITSSVMTVEPTHVAYVGCCSRHASRRQRLANFIVASVYISCGLAARARVVWARVAGGGGGGMSE